MIEEYLIMKCWKPSGDDVRYDKDIYVKIDDVLFWEQTGKIRNLEMLQLKYKGYRFQPQRFSTFVIVKGDIRKCLKV